MGFFILKMMSPTIPMLKLLYRSQMSALPARCTAMPPAATVSQDGECFIQTIGNCYFHGIGSWQQYLDILFWLELYTLASCKSVGTGCSSVDMRRVSDTCPSVCNISSDQVLHSPWHQVPRHVSGLLHHGLHHGHCHALCHTSIVITFWFFLSLKTIERFIPVCTDIHLVLSNLICSFLHT